MGKTLGLRS